MAIKVRTSGEKWARRTSAAQGDYVQGVQNPRRSWQQATAAAQDAYEQGIQESIALKSFAKGVSKAGDAKYQKGVVEKGATRFAQGVQASGDAYEQGFAPYAQTMETLNLPARGRRGDPKNYQRSQMVGEALNKKRTQLKSGK